MQPSLKRSQNVFLLNLVSFSVIIIINNLCCFLLNCNNIESVFNNPVLFDIALKLTHSLTQPVG